jgi:precorrin-4/cobalt-precorrin-4 C11-methyltransferase
LFLSITLLHKVCKELIECGWLEDSPVVVVQKASWGDAEKIVRGTLRTIKKQCQAEKISSQAMIIVSPTLGARHWDSLTKSKLYDEHFSHYFRKATVKQESLLQNSPKIF